jgi:hypothetical protein
VSQLDAAWLSLGVAWLSSGVVWLSSGAAWLSWVRRGLVGCGVP